MVYVEGRAVRGKPDQDLKRERLVVRKMIMMKIMVKNK